MSSVDLIFNLIGKDKTAPAFKSAGDSMARLGKTADAAGRSTSKAGDDADKAGGRMRRAFTGVDAGLDRVGKAALAAGAALGGIAIAGAAAGIVKSAKAASDLGESINAVNVTFGEAAGGIQQLGLESAKALGMSRTEFNSLAVQFSNFASTIAGPGGDVAKTMDELTTRASDFASVMNLDVAEAATLFQSGLAGETEPLRKYGIDLSAAAVEAYALANGIGDGTGELTEQEKVMARYAIIMESTSKTAGDFANTQGSMANQSKLLRANLENFAATVGTAFTPLAEAIMPRMNEVLVDMTDTLAANMPAISEKMREFGTQAGDALAKLADRWPEIKAKIEEIAQAVEDNWPDIKDTAENIGAALERVSGFVGAMWDAFRSLPPEVQQLIALLAVAQKTGVIDVAFKGAELVKGLVSNINAAVVNVNGAPTGGIAGKAGKAAPVVAGGATTLGIAAGAAGVIGASVVIDRSTESLSRATSAANVYASALEQSRKKVGDTAAATNVFAGATTAAGGAMTAAGYQAAALSQAVWDAGKKAGLTQEQIVSMSFAVQALPPGANAQQLAEALRVAGEKAGLSAEQIAVLTSEANLVPAAANLPLLASAIDAAGKSGAWTAEQTRIMSEAVAAIPPGATAAQAGEAIRIAGEKAGLSDQQVRQFTGSVGAIPATANLPALQSAITTAGRQAGWTDEQVRIMSSSVFAIPNGATAEQMGEAIRIAGQKAGLTDEQIQALIESVNNIPPDTQANITTNATEQRDRVEELRRSIGTLSGTTVDIGLVLRNTGAGAGFSDAAVSYYSGGGGGGGNGMAKAPKDWLDSNITGFVQGEVKKYFDSLPPMLAPGNIGTGPWVRPTSNYVVSSEWMRGGNAIHYGIDLAAPMGTPVHAVSAGTVSYAGWNNGYGNFVEIDHGGGATSYAHMSSILARVGQLVGPGTVIGTVGSTGDSTGPHLHFETLPGYRAVEPRGFMASKGVSLRTGGMVPVNVSNGEWRVPASKVQKHLPLLQAINAGQINGPGSGTSDSIRGAAWSGDFVVNAKQTQRHRRLLRSITYGDGPSQYLSGGGMVGGGSSGGGVSKTVVEVYLDGRLLNESLVRYRREAGVA